jgi:hypothetical protein
MKAVVTEICGLYIRYVTEDGREDIDDSTFDEIMTVEKGDVIELSERRIKELKTRRTG